MDENSISLMSGAQANWAQMPMQDRLRVLSNARKTIASRAAEFADSVSLPGRRTPVETLPMEVIPLLDALRFLERNAARLLATKRLRRWGRPLWLTGISAEIRREPFGTVLVIAPFNYPLFLPGVQVVQALAAGNAVLVKPSPGHAGPMVLLRKALVASGLPADLLYILEDSADAARAAIKRGVDKIVLTGSAATGRAVLAQAAASLTPAVVELSGNDAVFILEGADLDLTAQALAYGVKLNGGATCIAPRRVFVPTSHMSALREKLESLLQDAPSYPIAKQTSEQAQLLLKDAVSGGAQLIGGTMSERGMTPALLIEPSANAGVLTEDIFAPILSLISVSTPEDALARAAKSPFALGAAIFGAEKEAARLATRINAGIVVINDLIVPTADPRLSFEGRGQSGYGATRGAEGLLEMTRTKATTIRRSRKLPHLTSVETAHAEFFLNFIDLVYGGGRLPLRLRKGWRLATAALRLR